MDFNLHIQIICDKALKVLKQPSLRFRPMKRKARVDTKRGFVIARTNLKTKLITIDILTPRNRKPKKISSILRSLCHEVAHHQKKPYRQRFRGRWIIRQHYPKFYTQVTKNIEKLKSNNELGKYFSRIVNSK